MALHCYTPCVLAPGTCNDCGECWTEEYRQERLLEEKLENKRRKLHIKRKIRWLQCIQVTLFYTLTGFPKRKHMYPGEEITWRSEEEYVGLI